jgi:hypothetical protein
MKFLAVAVTFARLSKSSTNCTWKETLFSGDSRVFAPSFFHLAVS